MITSEKSGTTIENISTYEANWKNFDMRNFPAQMINVSDYTLKNTKTIPVSAAFFNCCCQCYG